MEAAGEKWSLDAFAGLTKYSDIESCVHAADSPQAFVRIYRAAMPPSLAHRFVTPRSSRRNDLQQSLSVTRRIDSTRLSIGGFQIHAPHGRDEDGPICCVRGAAHTVQRQVSSPIAS